MTPLAGFMIRRTREAELTLVKTDYAVRYPSPIHLFDES